MPRGKTISLAAIALAVAAVSSTSAQPVFHASWGGKTDRGVYPEPPLPQLPPAGGVIIDPTFGTSILRVTDEHDGEFLQVAYSYWPTFNRDSTRLFVLRDDSGLEGVRYRFDPLNFRLLEQAPLFVGPSPDGDWPRTEDAIWSGVNPDVIFCHSRLNLWAYNVATDAYALVRDFSPELGEGYLSQMSRSIDDDTFACTTLNRRYRVSGSLAWRRTEDRVFIRPVEPEGLDEVQIDKTGRYLVISTGAQGEGAIQNRVVDLETGLEEELIDGPPDYAPGHKDVGHGFCIGHDNWTNRLRSRKLSDPHQKKPILDFNDDWSQDQHVSLLADNEDWALVSLYEQGLEHVPGLFHDELLMVATDGSQRVRRLAHHRSYVDEYWESPRANISRDGRFIAFSSNWGQPQRRDVFILRVPGSLPALKVVPLPSP